ncbi:MAG: hypothetical protein S0880_02880 [Actinomycetota bacterium]|nr:hypothetical protein [Actinomycetota bacterium]
MVSSGAEASARVRLIRRGLDGGPLWLRVDRTSPGCTIPRGARVRVELRDHPTIGDVWACATPDGEILVHRLGRSECRALAIGGTAGPAHDAPVPASALVGVVVEIESSRGAQRLRRAEAALETLGTVASRTARHAANRLQESETVVGLARRTGLPWHAAQDHGATGSGAQASNVVHLHPPLVRARRRIARPRSG